jgi:hypothetical protein
MKANGKTALDAARQFCKIERLACVMRARQPNTTSGQGDLTIKFRQEFPIGGKAHELESKHRLPTGSVENPEPTV